MLNFDFISIYSLKNDVLLIAHTGEALELDFPYNCNINFIKYDNFVAI